MLLYRHWHEAPLLLMRAGLVATILGVALGAALAWLPWPGTITAPAIVEYTDLSLVRSGVAGFVEQVHVCDGQPVEAGRLLLELRNDDLQLEMRELELAVSQAAARHRCALNERDAGQAQVVLRNQEALLERLAEKRQRCDRLRVYAPVGGRIVGRNLRNLLGTYVKEGTELLAVGDERRKELRVSIAQDQVDEVLPLLGQTTRFRVGDCHLYAGTLSRIEPRATRELPHPALSATVGGPLSIKAAAERGGPTESQLVEPRFPGVVTLAPEMCGQLACGDRGYALFGLRREPAGQYLWQQLSQWFQQLGKSRGST